MFPAIAHSADSPARLQTKSYLLCRPLTRARKRPPEGILVRATRIVCSRDVKAVGQLNLPKQTRRLTPSMLRWRRKSSMRPNWSAN